jgi:uncharacterized protein YodC (DUF2158 family)
MSALPEDEAFLHIERAKAWAHAMADRIARVAEFQGEIRPGKLVKLKSGGPPMTVAVFDVTDGLIYCHWIAGGRPFAARYSAEMLEPAARGAVPPPPAKRGPPALAHSAKAAHGPSPSAANIPESAGESEGVDSRNTANIPESAGEPAA